MRKPNKVIRSERHHTPRGDELINDLNVSTSTWYSAPSYSMIMRRHWGWGGGGLLVRKRVQEVWEKKRKKGKIVIIINQKFTGRVGVNSRLGLGSLVRKI